MQDFLKDHGEWVVAIIGYFGAGILLIFGLGKWTEKQKGHNEETDKRVTALEKTSESRKLLCPNLMTRDDCEDRQADCKELQALNHSHVIERLDAFQLSQSDANKVHTEQYSSIMKILANRNSG